VSCLVPAVSDSTGGALSPWLTAAGALAMVASVERTCACPVSIEWPNDVVVVPGDGTGYLKIGGVLVEPTARRDAAVLGIGLNVDVSLDEFPEELKPVASSLTLAFGVDADRRALFGTYLTELESRLARLEALCHELRSRTATVGRAFETDSMHGIAVSIDEHMRLIVEAPDGTRGTLPFRQMGESV
jgi:BirA family biotin operon repressor/biotin-[acetyl-CoA-carboxylase] ligase